MILDAIVIAALLVFIFWGVKRGLAKMVFSLVSMAVSLLAGFFLCGPVSALLEKLEVADGLAGRLEESDALGHLPGVMLDLPFTSAAENMIYRSVAGAAVSVMSFVAVVIVVKLVLFFITTIVGLASSLPVVHQANGLAGGVIGFCLGILFELLIFAVIGALEAFGRFSVMGTLIADSHIAALMYDGNPLLSVLIN